MLIGFEQDKGREKQGKAQTIRFVVDKVFKAKLAQHPDIALAYALENLSEQQCRIALQKGASLETTLYLGNTPMHQAVKEGKIDRLRLLHRLGANINAVNYAKETPLLLALLDNKREIIDFLVEIPDIDVTIDSKKKKSPLAIALAKKDIPSITAFMKIPNMSASHFIDFFKNAISRNESDTVKSMLGINQWLSKISTEARSELLNYAINSKARLAILQALLSCQNPFFTISYANILTNLDHFDATSKITEFLALDEPLFYIEEHQLASPVAIAALKILQMKADVKTMEADLQDADIDQHGVNEDAMSDKTVKLANKHYKETVEPTFQEPFLSHSKKRDPHEALLAVEKKIRSLILEEINQKAQAENNQVILTFIKKTKKSLIAGTPKAMKESVAIFKEITPEQAAWRCYNPHAPVSGDWDNLLTPSNRERIFTSVATGINVLNGATASNMVRQRVAHYFLAVVEGDDEPLKRNRIVNFIQVLSEIRNARGINNPSCFPGTLTRIALLGAFHELAQLPPSFEVKCQEWMKENILSVFAEKSAALPTLPEKYDLLHALTELAQENAIDVIKDQTRYNPEWLALRQDFIDSLGNPMTIFNKVKESVAWEVDNSELVRVHQHLLDVAKGDIAVIVEESLEKSLDSVPTLTQISEANPFDKVRTQRLHQMADIFLDSLKSELPFYLQSKRKLINVMGYVQQKGQVLVKSEFSLVEIDALFENLEGLEEAKHSAREHFVAECHKVGFSLAQPKLKNPYFASRDMINSQIKHTPQTQMALMLKKRLPALEQKAQLFEDFLAKLQKCFETEKMQIDEIKEFLSVLTEHVYEQSSIEFKELEEALADSQVLMQFIKKPSVLSVLNPHNMQRAVHAL